MPAPKPLRDCAGMEKRVHASRIGAVRSSIFAQGIGGASRETKHVAHHLARVQLQCALAELVLAISNRPEQSDRALSRQVGPGTSRVQVAIRILIDLHLTRPEVRRAIMAAHITHGLPDESLAVVRRAVDRIVAWRFAAGRPRVDGAAMFLASRCVVGIV